MLGRQLFDSRIYHVFDLHVNLQRSDEYWIGISQVCEYFTPAPTVLTATCSLRCIKSLWLMV